MQGPSSMQNQNPPPPPPGGSGLAPNVASMLCYLCGWITGLIFILIEKQNREVKFHAWQALFLGIAMAAFWIIFMVLFAIAAQIAAFLVTIFWIIYVVIALGFLVLWIVAMVKAYQGEHWVMPVIGPLAEQQANK